jgi:hypothetical protein
LTLSRAIRTLLPMGRADRLLTLLFLALGFLSEALPSHEHALFPSPSGARTESGCGEEQSSLHLHAGQEIQYAGCSVAPLLAGLSLVPPATVQAPAAHVAAASVPRGDGSPERRLSRRAPARAPPATA